MLLRSLTKHVRDQNWFAVLLDFFIVVAGILIAFQITNWSDGLSERAQEREYLIRLHDDFVESINGQTRDLNFLDQELSDQAAIMRSLDACAVVLEDDLAFQRGINTLGYINAPRILRRTVDELVAAGRTDIIKNSALKDQLSVIIALVEWRGGGFTETVARTTEHYRFIIEEEVRYDFSRKYPDPFLKEFIGVDFDIKTLCQSPKIAKAVSAISYATLERRRAYAPILQQYKDFLPVLEEELRSRWGPGFTQPEEPAP